MSVPTQAVPTRIKSAVALLLTFVAGSVDAVGYLTLQHVFTAHVTGATANLGIHLQEKSWSEAAMAGTVVAAFLVGSILGRVIVEIASQARFRRVASITLGMELLLIGVFIIESGKTMSPTHLPSLEITCWLLAALAGAMGVQTATLTRVGSLTVHTTFVTGMLNKLAQLVSHVLFETYGLNFGSPHLRAYFKERRVQSLMQAKFVFAIWCIYLAGALIGAFLESRKGPRILMFAIVLLLVAIGMDWIRPLSLEEEKDQSER